MAEDRGRVCAGDGYCGPAAIARQAKSVGSVKWHDDLRPDMWDRRLLAAERMNSVPRIVVISSLFPSAAQPAAGLFIRERMFRVGRRLPLAVVSPQPWFPLQGIIRLWRPGYRPRAVRREVQQGVDVYFPRFFAIPGVLRRLDGFFMAVGCLPMLLRLRRTFGFTLLDAHFAYPCGYAARLLGRWLGVPVVVTLRGTEPGHVRRPALRGRIAEALRGAARVITVSDSLRVLAVEMGVSPTRIRVIGNGVDLVRFRPVSRQMARAHLAIPDTAKVLISVGGLVERKGFHRVIEAMPELLVRFPDLRYLIVGGASPEGDMTAELRARVRRLGLDDRVTFLGTVAPDELNLPLSAADVFVLATRNEGWANVLLEAMAVGLPVVTTDVGGNREVVANSSVGMVVPFGDAMALRRAIEHALTCDWNRVEIMAYAQRNSWDEKIDALVGELTAVVDERATAPNLAPNA